MMQPLRIAIVGYGIGGMAAAIQLRRHGHAIVHFERNAATVGGGGGLLLHPPAQRELQTLGVLAAAMERGAPVRHIRARTVRGQSLLELAYPASGDRFGLGITRDTLHRLLYEADGGRDRVRRDCAIVDLVDGSHLVDSAGQRHGPFDLIVVADGSRSTLGLPMTQLARPFELAKLLRIVLLVGVAGSAPVSAQDSSGCQTINGTRVLTEIFMNQGYARFSNACGSQTLTQRQLEGGAIPDQIIPCPRPAPRGITGDEAVRRFPEEVARILEEGNERSRREDERSRRESEEAHPGMQAEAVHIGAQGRRVFFRRDRPRCASSAPSVRSAQRTRRKPWARMPHSRKASNCEVDEVVMPVTTAIPQIRAGKVRALAVLTEQRVATLPEVPTGKEAGVDGFTMPLWYGMFAPAGTPRDIVSRLNRELVRALEAPDIRERLTIQGVEPWPGTPEQLGELLRVDIERYGTIVRSAGLRRQ